MGVQTWKEVVPRHIRLGSTISPRHCCWMVYGRFRLSFQPKWGKGWYYKLDYISQSSYLNEGGLSKSLRYIIFFIKKYILHLKITNHKIL